MKTDKSFEKLMRETNETALKLADEGKGIFPAGYESWDDYYRAAGKFSHSTDTYPKDTGERTKFNTGAEKDLGGIRGRYDLLPLETLSLIYKHQGDETIFEFLDNIYQALVVKDTTSKAKHLATALRYFTTKILGVKLNKVVPSVAVMFELGAKKYSERDWEKGRPMIVYINSTLRHFFQVLNEETDENHEAAVVWNLLTCIDTIRRLPSLAYTLDVFKEEN